MKAGKEMYGAAIIRINAHQLVGFLVMLIGAGARIVGLQQILGEIERGS